MVTILDSDSCNSQQEKLRIEHARTFNIYKTKATMTSNETAILQNLQKQVLFNAMPQQGK
jgi:hypothetical protein